MSDKRADFLWIVQTTVLANCARLAAEREGGKLHIYSATGVAGMAGDAVAASYRIPVAMSAREAALQFCSFMLTNLRQPEEKCPEWLTALNEPSPSVYETRGLLSV